LFSTEHSVQNKIADAYRENAAEVLCGFAMMGGQSNIYSLYCALKAADEK
jgi:hypothetical protein